MWNVFETLFGGHAFDDLFTLTPSIIRPTSTGWGRHRSAGTRAHRQWKRRRAAGITKRVRA
jgi:hypothetical protein